MLKVCLIGVLIFWCSGIFGFVGERSSLGNQLKWPGKFAAIKFNLNTSNISGLDSTEIVSATQNSMDNWNNSNAVNLVVIEDPSGADSFRNNISFVSSFSLGSGVIGTTQVAFSPTTGKIFEADIFLNELDFTLTTTVGGTDNLNGTSIYIGDVISHELGHALGLGHSQVEAATMVFTTFNGRHKVHNDDLLGASHIYGVNNSGGTISGTVIGSDDLVGVFGAHVQLISTSTGEVLLGGFTDAGGTFLFQHIPLDDTYYVYVSPINPTASIPNYLKSARSNFCAGRTDFRGSYVKSCLRSDQGRPMGVALDATNPSVGLGHVTIGCNLSFTEDYLTIKDEATPSTITLTAIQANGSTGETVTGFFTNDQITANTADTYTIDLSGYAVPSADAHIDIKAISQGLFSRLRYTLDLTNADNTTTVSVPSTGTAEVDFVGNPSFDLTMRAPLDFADPTKNVFTLTVTPQTTTFGGFEDKQAFPENVYNENVNHYLMILSISEKQVDGSFKLVDVKDHTPLTDNTSCPQGENTVAQAPFETPADVEDLDPDRFKSEGFTCGSLTGNGGEGGPGGGVFILLSFLIGFILVMGVKFLDKVRGTFLRGFVLK